MSNKPKTSSSKGFFLLLILLMIVVAIVVVMRSCASKESEPEASPIVSVEPTAAPTEAPEFTPSPSPSPTTMPSPTPSPTPETSATPEPTPTPTPVRDVQASGSFSSDTGTGVNIVVDWIAYSGTDGNIVLETELYVKSYSINVGKIYKGASITVNGESYTIDSPEVKYDGDEQAKSLILSKSFTVPYTGQGSLSIPISATWNFKGKYSGNEIDSVKAESAAAIG